MNSNSNSNYNSDSDYNYYNYNNNNSDFNSNSIRHLRAAPVRPPVPRSPRLLLLFLGGSSTGTTFHLAFTEIKQTITTIYNVRHPYEYVCY